MAAEQHKGTVTTLLHDLREGREGAADELMAIVYDELRRIASRFMAKVPNSDTLQPTALVSEAYLRLLGKTEMDWQNRGQFFALAARAMHDIIVEQARRHSALKRGGDRQRISLEHTEIAVETQADDVLALSEALNKLREDDCLAAEVVMLEFFSGLTHEQTALALDLPRIKVRRHWQYAKAFLYRELERQNHRS